MITAATPLPSTFSSGPALRTSVSASELAALARECGIDPELLVVQDNNAPDCVTITLRKPDGRSLRRVVPRDCWNDSRYRSSLIRDMNLILV